jgi:hypothetical protein
MQASDVTSRITCFLAHCRVVDINTDGLPKDREELQGKLHRFMQKLAKLPARVASYFEHKYIAYAAALAMAPT